jgi:hypothetical protein
MKYNKIKQYFKIKTRGFYSNHTFFFKKNDLNFKTKQPQILILIVNEKTSRKTMVTAIENEEIKLTIIKIEKIMQFNSLKIYLTIMINIYLNINISIKNECRVRDNSKI